MNTIIYIASNFRHYGTNRAPMVLGFNAAWLEVNKGFTKELERWIRDILADHSDVYFVTQIQVCLLFNLNYFYYLLNKSFKLLSISIF